MLYLPHVISALTQHAHIHCMIHFTVENKQTKRERNKNKNAEHSTAERREEYEREKEKKKTWETSKEEEDMMEQARGRGNQTPLSPSRTHNTNRACMSLMSEKRVNPCWRLITQPHSQGEFGDFSLLSHLADTHLYPGDVRLCGCTPKKTCPLFTITGPMLTVCI